jgi:hypothetical protein
MWMLICVITASGPSRWLCLPQTAQQFPVPRAPLRSGVHFQVSLSPVCSPATSRNKYRSGFIRIRKALENYPEVKLEFNESGHGLLLSFLKVAPQPESRPVTDQVTDQVTAEVFRLLTVMRGPMSRLEIQSALGLKHLPHLRDAYLAPAIKEKLLEMTIPEKPQSRLQKYRPTPAREILVKKIKPTI